MARHIEQPKSLRPAFPANGESGMPPRPRGRKLVEGAAAQDTLTLLFDEIFEESPLEARMPALSRS